MGINGFVENFGLETKVQSSRLRRTKKIHFNSTSIFFARIAPASPRFFYGFEL
jgi:hypothetical protein